MAPLIKLLPWIHKYNKSLTQASMSCTNWHLPSMIFGLKVLQLAHHLPCTPRLSEACNPLTRLGSAILKLLQAAHAPIQSSCRIKTLRSKRACYQIHTGWKCGMQFHVTPNTNKSTYHPWQWALIVRKLLYITLVSQFIVMQCFSLNFPSLSTSVASSSPLVHLRNCASLARRQS